MNLSIFRDWFSSHCIYNVAHFLWLPTFKHVLGKRVVLLTWVMTVFVGCYEGERTPSQAVG